MQFAVLLPWWGYALAFGSAIVLAWLAYARIPTPLGAGTRALLIGLRALTLLLLIAMLLRPVMLVPPSAANNSLLPILVDVSRSMRLTDGGGPSRLARAQAIVRDLQAKLSTEYRRVNSDSRSFSNATGAHKVIFAARGFGTPSIVGHTGWHW